MWKKEDFKNEFTNINDSGFAYAWLYGVLSSIIRNDEMEDAKNIVKWMDEIEQEKRNQ